MVPVSNPYFLSSSTHSYFPRSHNRCARLSAVCNNFASIKAGTRLCINIEILWNVKPGKPTHLLQIILCFSNYLIITETKEQNKGLRTSGKTSLRKTQRLAQTKKNGCETFSLKKLMLHPLILKPTVWKKSHKRH